MRLILSDWLILYIRQWDLYYKVSTIRLILWDLYYKISTIRLILSDLYHEMYIHILYIVYIISYDTTDTYYKTYYDTYQYIMRLILWDLYYKTYTIRHTLQYIIMLYIYYI